MPSSTTLWRRRLAPSGSSGGPQIPSPVMRMAPNPSRRTSRSSPMLKVSIAMTLATRAIDLTQIYQVGRAGRLVTKSSMRGVSPVSRPRMVLLAVLAAILAVVVSAAPAVAKKDDPPKRVLIIVLDQLRPDYID